MVMPRRLEAERYTARGLRAKPTGARFHGQDKRR
jgi:hypothetical protein